MHIQSTLHSRSTSSSGGVDGNTVIFIVVGVVCLLVILAGFYLVSRPRAAPNNTPSVPTPHPQHSPITQPPRRVVNEYWKIWRAWRYTHTHGTNLPTTTDTATSQVSPTPVTVASPSRVILARGGSKSYPPITLRPSHARRITSLSVATSFSHSHITEEALDEFRASAYDLDGDLETEMLNSARDDAWLGRALIIGEGCGGMGVEEGMEARGNATPIMEGGVEGYVSPWPATQPNGDYENSDACQRVASGSNDDGGDVIEGNTVAVERQVLQEQC